MDFSPHRRHQCPWSSIVGYRQHILPSYIGLRFEYRWPYDNDVNYWSNSPVQHQRHDVPLLQPSLISFGHYAAGLITPAKPTVIYGVHRFVRNDSPVEAIVQWLGCYWKPTEGSAN